jgi:hypothetical protein
MEPKKKTCESSFGGGMNQKTHHEIVAKTK